MMFWCVYQVLKDKVCIILWKDQPSPTLNASLDLLSLSVAPIPTEDGDPQRTLCLPGSQYDNNDDYIIIIIILLIIIIIIIIMANCHKSDLKVISKILISTKLDKEPIIQE